MQEIIVEIMFCANKNSTGHNYCYYLQKKQMNLEVYTFIPIKKGFGRILVHICKKRTICHFVYIYISYDLKNKNISEQCSF